MSQEANGNGRVGDPPRLVVVRVEDTIEPRLTAHTGSSYRSPAQTREQAMTLVRLLLGRDPAGEECRWTAPVAGGRRLVTLSEEPSRCGER